MVCKQFWRYYYTLFELAYKNNFSFLSDFNYSVPAIESAEEFRQSNPKQSLENTIVPIKSPNEYQKFFILLKSYYTQLYRDWVSDMTTKFKVKWINL
jgi:hypothetical protein